MRRCNLIIIKPNLGCLRKMEKNIKCIMKLSGKIHVPIANYENIYTIKLVMSTILI